MLEDRNQIEITWDEYYPETGRLTGSKEEGSNPGQRESPGFGRSRTPWHIYFFCFRAWIFSRDNYSRNDFWRGDTRLRRKKFRRVIFSLVVIGGVMEEFMTIFLNPLMKELFQRITTHRKRRERGKWQTSVGKRPTSNWLVDHTEPVFRHTTVQFGGRRRVLQTFFLTWSPHNIIIIIIVLRWVRVVPWRTWWPAALLQTCVKHTMYLSNWDSTMVTDLVNCTDGHGTRE